MLVICVFSQLFMIIINRVVITDNKLEISDKEIEKLLKNR